MIEVYQKSFSNFMEGKTMTLTIGLQVLGFILVGFGIGTMTRICKELASQPVREKDLPSSILRD